MTVAERINERHARLIHREADMATLREQLEASTIRGRAVVIRGDAGVGKSALLGQFLKDAAGLAAIAVGSCVEMEARRPFGAFAEIVRALRTAYTPDVVDRTIRDRARELHWIDAPSSLPGTHSIDDATGRYRVHAAFLGALDALTRIRPLILAVEDLHWADAASLELFGYVARRAANRRVLLVATTRSEADGSDAARAVAELAASRFVLEVAVAPLPLRGTRELVSMLLDMDGRPLGGLAAAIERIHDRSQGNPLFVEELVRTLRDERLLIRRDGSWHCDPVVVERVLPRSVVESVGGRMRGLDAETRRVIAAASLFIRPFDASVLATLLGTDERATQQMLDAARSAGLLLETADGQLRFRHALLRAGAQRHLTDGERRALHVRIASLLAGRADAAASSEEIAEHFHAGGDATQARAYYLRAAGEAAGGMALADAARRLERVLELTARDDPERPVVLERLSRCYWVTGRTDRAEQVAFEAIDLAERAGHRHLAGRSLMTLSFAYGARGDNAREEEVRERAGEVLLELGPTTDLAFVHTSRAVSAFSAGRPDDGLRSAEEGGRIAEAVPPSPDEQETARRTTALAVASTFAGWGLLLLRRWTEAIPRLQRGYDLAQSCRDPRALVAATGNLLVGLQCTSGEEAVLRRLHAEVRSARRQFLSGSPAMVRGELADLMTDGSWDELSSLALDERDTIQAHVPSRTLLAAVATARTGHGDAFEGLREGSGGLAGFVAFWSAIALTLGQRYEQAAALARHEIPSDSPIALLHRPWQSPLAYLVGAVASRRMGDDRARDEFLEMANAPRAMDVLVFPAHRAVHAALLEAERAVATRQLAEAIAAYDDAVTACGTSSFLMPAMLWLEHLTMLERADRLVDRSAPGDRDRAQRDVDSIVEYWQRTKATWYLRRLREWARPRGLRAPELAAPTAAVASPLTNRENEVAELVASGLTDREIAERLTLSVRTIESHVEKIRAKLGFRSRAQVAGWVAQHMRLN